MCNIVHNNFRGGHSAISHVACNIAHNVASSCVCTLTLWNHQYNLIETQIHSPVEGAALCSRSLSKQFRIMYDIGGIGELSADARPMRRSSVGRASVERRSTHDRCRSTLDRRSTNVGRASLECRSCVGRASVDSRPTSRPTHDRQSLNVEPTLSVACRSTVDRSPADSRSPVGRHSCVVKLLFVEHQQRGLRVTVLGTLRIY